MGNANKLKVTMLFPVYDNEGHPFEPETLVWYDNEIARIFYQGGTELGMVLVRGWWRGASDLNRCIWAIVAEEMLDEIRKFLQAAAGKLGQQKMYFEYHPTTYEEVG